jgi:hypothetical protein
VPLKPNTGQQTIWFNKNLRKNELQRTFAQLEFLRPAAKPGRF